MHVIINRNALLDVLNVAAGIAASRTTKDVLKCVRLTVVDSTLLVSATDLEVALRGRIAQVEVKKAGDLLVPADKIMSITRESMDETLTIEGDEQTCHIRGGDSHFEIYGQDPREFPPVPDLEGDADIELESEALSTLIERTLFAVAKENTRYAINGVLWHKDGKKLSLVGTDGRRLARALVSPSKMSSNDAQTIVPAKTMQTLQRILGHAEGSVKIRFAENQIIVQAGSYALSSALVEGHFPDYEVVIPSDSNKRIELPTDEFLSAVKRAALLTNEQSKGVRLSFGEGKLVLSSRAPEQGEATVSMAAGYDGEPLEIGFNPAFLADALRVVNTPAVHMELKDGTQAGMIKAGQEFLYVVMPVNLS